MIVTALGALFIVVSTPRIWAKLDRASLALNPVRRWSHKNFPGLDRCSLRFARFFLLALGVLVLPLGIALLAADRFN